MARFRKNEIKNILHGNSQCTLGTRATGTRFAISHPGHPCYARDVNLDVQRNGDALSNAEKAASRLSPRGSLALSSMDSERSHAFLHQMTVVATRACCRDAHARKRLFIVRRIDLVGQPVSTSRSICNYNAARSRQVMARLRGAVLSTFRFTGSRKHVRIVFFLFFFFFDIHPALRLLLRATSTCTFFFAFFVEQHLG